MSDRAAEPFAELRGHEHSVTCVDFSRDGRRLVSGSHDDTVCLWDVPSATQKAHFTGHQHSVYSARLSPDGTRCASSDVHGVVLVWDVNELVTIKELKGHTETVLGLSWSSDGLRLATASEDMTVRVWDVASGTALFVLEGHADWVFCVEFSSDAQLLVSGSTDKTARVWDMRDGKEVAVLETSAEVRMVAFSSDKKTVITVSWDNTVRCFDLATKKETRQIKTKHANEIETAALSPDQSCIVSSDIKYHSATCSVRVTHIGTGEELAVLAENKQPIWGVTFSPDGLWIAAGGEDNVVWLWKTPDAVRKVFTSNIDDSFHTVAKRDAASKTKSLLDTAAVEDAIAALQGDVAAGTTKQIIGDTRNDVAAARSHVDELKQSLGVAPETDELRRQIGATFTEPLSALERLMDRVTILAKQADAHFDALDATVDSLSCWNAQARFGVIQLDDAVIEANVRHLTAMPEPLQSPDADSRIGQLREAIDELTKTIGDFGHVYA